MMPRAKRRPVHLLLPCIDLVFVCDARTAGAEFTRDPKHATCRSCLARLRQRPLLGNAIANALRNVPVKPVQWACDCPIGAGDRDAPVHLQGCAASMQAAAGASTVKAAGGTS